MNQEKKAARKERRAARRAKRKARPLWKKILEAVIIAAIVIAIISTIVYIVSNFGKWINETTQKRIADIMIADDVPEDVIDISPLDEEGAKTVGAIPTYDEKDTWAVYIYMCGSNLEGAGLNQLSDVTQELVNPYVEEFEEVTKSTKKERMFKFVDELEENGLDLPKFMYNARINKEKKKDDPVDQTSNPPGAASHDIENMEYVNLPENVQVVIQTGGAKRWKNPLANPNRSNILLYNSEGISQIEDNHISNMGEASTLSDFMTYCKDNYPADHEVLILYNHGGGPFGICWDDIYGEDNLSLDELTEAFSTVYGANPKEKPFELIACHACLMSNLDVLKTFAPYGKYFCAGEEVLTDMSIGLMKYYLLAEFENGTATNGAQIAKTATDVYVDLWGRFGKDEILGRALKVATDLSVVDLNKVDAVYDAYDELMDKALEDAINNPASMTKVAKAAGQSTRFAMDSASAYNLIDLGLFMDALEDTYPNETAKVKEGLKESILYHRGTYEFKDTQGMSVYFPVEVKDKYGLNKYLEYIDTISKSDSTRAFYYYKVAGCLNDEHASYAKSQGYGSARILNTQKLNRLQNEKVAILDDGNYSVTPKIEEMDLVQDCKFILGKYDEKTEKIVYYGDGINASLSEDGKLSSSFDGTWISIDGHPLATEIIDHSNGLIRYRSLVRVENGGLPKNYYLILGEKEATGEIDLLGISEAGDKVAPDMTGRAALELKAGDKIIPIFETNNVGDDDNPNIIENEDGKGFKYSVNLKITRAKISDGTYLSAVDVVDLRGDTYSTAVVQIDIKNGKIKESKVREDILNNAD